MPDLDLETKATFSSKVLQFCSQNEFTLLEGLQEYIQNRRIEFEDVPNLLTNEFKAMLQKEAIDLNMFKAKTTSKVTFDE